MNNKFFLLIALFILSGLSACVSSLKSQRNAVLEHEDFRKVLPIAQALPAKPQFPKVTMSELHNGLKLYVVEDKSLPIVQVQLVFKGGSSLDPYGYAGLNNLTALMLKEGTKKLSSLALDEAFADMGTEVSVNATKDMVSLSAGILANKLPETLSLLADMVQAPRLDQKDFDRLLLQEKNALISRNAQASYKAQVSFIMAAYGEKHPYAYPSFGTNETLAKLTLAAVKKAHKSNYGPNLSALVLVGDITLEEGKKLAARYFGAWKAIKSPLSDLAAPLSAKKMQTRLIGRSNTPQTFLLLGNALATAKDKDLAQFEVLQNILAGLPTSRLDALLREQKGWTYGVNSAVIPLRGIGPMMLTTSIQIPYGSDALNEILKEFEDLKTKEISQTELDNAKNSILKSFAQRYTTINKVASNIANNFIYDLGQNHDEKYYEDVEKVTSKNIMHAAQRMLNKNTMIAVAVGELDVMKIPLAKMDVGEVIIEDEDGKKIDK
jgi:zinc protease